MAILPIIEAPDPRLKVKSTPVAAGDDGLRTLIADMLETMYAAPGIGLAAVQVGVPKRLLVIDIEDREGEAGGRNPRHFINPKIVAVSEELRVYNEGCLSVPEYYAELERPARCKIRYRDIDGVQHEEALDGLLATCFQHEMDHLEGILFIDHLSALKRSMALRKLAKARRIEA